MGMQHQAGAAVLRFGRRVQHVAPDGVANGLHMHPQLVGAASQGLQFKP